MSCPYTSPQNGKAERIIRTINNVIRTVRINCIGQLGLGLLPPLGPQSIGVRVREAQPLVLLPPLAAALLAAGLTLMGCHSPLGLGLGRRSP
jgi:hypothetical protein